MTGLAVLTLTLSLFGLPAVVGIALGARLDWWARENHIIASYLVTPLVLFSHTMTTMHLVDTRKQTRELSQEHQLDPDLLRKATVLLRFYTPLSWLVVLIIVPGFIVGGAAHTKVLPGFLHWMPVSLAALLNLVAAPRGLWCIHESVELLWQVEHLAHGGTLPAPEREG